MSGLTIGWEYLTGYAVATDPASRERPEWPPHPARVFMALAAAWFQSGENAAEGEALRWLETLGNPQLDLPPDDHVFQRANVDFYVPVNDKAGPSSATLQCMPPLTRSKQSRTFPRVHVGAASCFMRWPHADTSRQYGEALDSLCAKVTRIGHSSSLVRMWVVGDTERKQADHEPFDVDDVHAQFHVRQVSTGFLDTLIGNFGEAPRQQKQSLEARIETLKSDKKSITGKGARERKATIDRKLEPLLDELATLVVHKPVRPTVGLWSGYSRTDQASSSNSAIHSYFDTDCLVLSRTAGRELALVSTLAVTEALRGAVMQGSVVQPVPQWVSGHQSNGERSDSSSGHLACIPLPFVGHEHADGHLLGVGLVFPRCVERRDRGRVLGKTLLAPTGQPREVELTLGRLGVWRLRKSDWSERRGTLQPTTWTAHPHGAATWASVTPVVLDRFPKANRASAPSAWRNEVAAIIADACQRIGLPRPEWVDFDTTGWQRGSPRALIKHRRLRGGNHDASAPLGSGFPRYPAKGTRASRPQVHALLHFASPVVGPVLLGTGRFLGYGLCKPYTGD